MNPRTRSAVVLALASGTFAGICSASVGRSLWVDAIGDAVIRRTDPGADGALLNCATLPDLLSVSLLPWAPIAPAEDPYTGLPASPEDANIVRIDVVLAGLVNPPGPLGLNGTDYAPDRFGASPVYGFVELDVDHDRDTGGEFHGQARSRMLGTAARFGGRIADVSLAGRTATCAADLDSAWTSEPFFERTGTDFSLALCGCFDAVIVSENGNCDGRLDAGETMIVEGRFFQRAGGYRLASQIIGGSDVGLYDPVVQLRFVHEPTSNLTVLTLVLPLTPAGAAALTGEPEQPIDMLIGGGSHFSIQEAIADLVAGASLPNSGLTHELIHRWSKKDPATCLNPLSWNAACTVATAYAEPEGSLYVWTDTGFETTSGDTDGDGAVTAVDRTSVEVFIFSNDGSPMDVDGERNGTFQLENIGPNFSLFDMTGDGSVSSTDVSWFQLPNSCPADWDRNGVVEVPDIFAFLSSWFSGRGDFDGNGINEVPDIFAYLAEWFANNCI
jgi:hypothetical protein